MRPGELDMGQGAREAVTSPAKPSVTRILLGSWLTACDTTRATPTGASTSATRLATPRRVNNASSTPSTKHRFSGERKYAARRGSWKWRDHTVTISTAHEAMTTASSRREMKKREKMA